MKSVEMKQPELIMIPRFVNLFNEINETMQSIDMFTASIIDQLRKLSDFQSDLIIDSEVKKQPSTIEEQLKYLVIKLDSHKKILHFMYDSLVELI